MKYLILPLAANVQRLALMHISDKSVTAHYVLAGDSRRHTSDTLSSLKKVEAKRVLRTSVFWVK